MIFTMWGKRRDANIPPILYNAYEPNKQININLINKLERFHDDHPTKEGKAYKLLGIFLDGHLSLNLQTDHLVGKLSMGLYTALDKQIRHPYQWYESTLLRTYTFPSFVMCITNEFTLL